MQCLSFIQNHLYLIGSLYYVLLCMILYVVHKESHRIILVVGCISLILAPIAEAMHVVDWWKPNFVFHTFINIEDLLFGFGFAGFSSGIYNIFKTKFRLKENTADIKWQIKMSVVIIFFMLFIGLFYLIKICSFWTSFISALFVIVTVLTIRRNALVPIMITGVVVLLTALPGYIIGIGINPAWFQNEWQLGFLSGITFLKIPIEEYVWFFVSAASMGAMSELLGNNKVFQEKTN
ncbi:MAG: hypothetical protein JWN78_3241 [Bacteroidota bacterium]|nr:hypothetical protein [Bacteroidota bacterium]